MKILITGSSGFLGKKVQTVLEKSYDIISTSHRSTNGDVPLEILDEKDVDAAFNQIRPEWVIHLAGIADPDFCEKNPQTAYKVNIKGTKNIVKACKAYKARLIFTSTDYVFDGENPPYTEKSKPNPINIYGKTKAEAETYILKEMSFFAAITRFSILYGFNDPNDRIDFICDVLKKIEVGESIHVDNIQVRHPVLLDDVARALKSIIKNKLSGIIHLTPEHGITKYKWALKIADSFNKQEHNIKAIMKKNIAPRPINCQLVNSRKNELGITCCEVGQGIDLIHKKLITYYKYEKKE